MMKLDLPSAVLDNTSLFALLQRELGRYGVSGVPPNNEPRILADAGVLAVYDASSINRQDSNIQIEDLPGPSLQAVMNAGAALQWPEVAAIIYAATRSQQTLCRASYVEVSPASIFVGLDASGNANVRVAPPALAQIINVVRFSMDMSLRGDIVNLPSYAYPPEMATGDKLDERSVVYELGAIAGKLLGSTAGNPLMGGGKNKLPAAFIEQQPQAATLINQAIAERPSQRPASPRAFADAIQSLVAPDAGVDAKSLPLSAEAKTRLQHAIDKATAQYLPPAAKTAEMMREIAPLTIAVALATLRGANGELSVREPGGLMGRPDAGKAPALDISPLDPQRVVSRYHADITYQKDGWYITLRDTARHRTFVNDHELRPSEPVPLQDGDTLRIARLTLTFHPSIVHEPAA